MEKVDAEGKREIKGIKKSTNKSYTNNTFIVNYVLDRNARFLRKFCNYSYKSSIFEKYKSPEDVVRKKVNRFLKDLDIITRFAEKDDAIVISKYLALILDGEVDTPEGTPNRLFVDLLKENRKEIVEKYEELPIFREEMITIAERKKNDKFLLPSQEAWFKDELEGTVGRLYFLLNLESSQRANEKNFKNDSGIASDESIVLWNKVIEFYNNIGEDFCLLDIGKMYIDKVSEILSTNFLRFSNITNKSVVLQTSLVCDLIDSQIKSKKGFKLFENRQVTDIIQNLEAGNYAKISNPVPFCIKNKLLDKLKEARL